MPDREPARFTLHHALLTAALLPLIPLAVCLVLLFNGHNDAFRPQLLTGAAVSATAAAALFAVTACGVGGGVTLFAAAPAAGRPEPDPDAEPPVPVRRTIGSALTAGALVTIYNAQAQGGPTGPATAMYDAAMWGLLAVGAALVCWPAGDSRG